MTSRSMAFIVHAGLPGRWSGIDGAMLCSTIEAKAMAVNERFDFSGRSVVITGGGKGIGKVYAEEFAKVGARVVAADIDAQAAENVAAALRQAGFEAFGLGVDIASEDSTKAMAQAALDKYASIDVLINN